MRPSGDASPAVGHRLWANRGDVDALAQAQICEVESKIADLSRLRDELVRIAGQCHGGRIADCRIIEALSPDWGGRTPSAR